MKTTLRAYAIVIVVAMAFAQLAAAQSPREKLLVNSAWLKRHLNDKDLVLLQVGDRAEYQKEHIPGARFITMSDLAQPMEHDENGKMKPGALILELPRPEAARGKLESLGISDKSRIVVYYGNDWVSPSTRIMHDLNWIGLGDRSSLLDGGMQEWKKQGGAVTAELPTITPGKLTAKPTNNVTVTYDWVLANLKTPNVRIIDARDRVFYDGVDGGARKGHIVGAGSFPFTETANDDNTIKSAAELKALFAKAGYKPGDTIISYCHIGQQGTAVVFAARTLGYKVFLYDGSFTDWETHAEAPVEKTTSKASQ